MAGSTKKVLLGKSLFLKACGPSSACHDALSHAMRSLHTYYIYIAERTYAEEGNGHGKKKAVPDVEKCRTTQSRDAFRTSQSDDLM